MNKPSSARVRGSISLALVVIMALTVVALILHWSLLRAW